MNEKADLKADWVPRDFYSYKARIVRVVDGDTFDADVLLGFNIVFRERFRLLGVNTPEKFGVKVGSDEHKAGVAATDAVLKMLGTTTEATIRTHKDSKGKYGRYLAEVFIGDDTESINTKLIHMGYGAEY